MSLRHELGKRGPFELPEEEAYLNLQRTACVLGAPFTGLFRRYGLSEATYNVLRILRGHQPQGVPSLRIGEQMVTRVPDVTRLVDRLEGLGLAERVRTEQDRRVVIVRATRAGLDALAALDRPLAELHKRQLGHLSRRELAELNRLLEAARYAQGRPPVRGAAAGRGARGARGGGRGAGKGGRGTARE